MAVNGVTNLAELFSNQSLGQGQEAPPAGQPVQIKAGRAGAPTEDTFTPSTQNSAQATAQAAGLFQVSQFALSSATADILSAQTAPPQGTQNGAPAQTGQTGTTVTAAPPGAPAPAPNVQAPAPVIAATSAPVVTPQAAANVAVPASIPAPAATPAAPPQATANAATTVANTQDQLQLLNADLLGLGLNNGQIQDIDLIASVTKNFNPTVYTDLIQQFEVQTPPQATAPAGANQPAAQAKADTV